jgi:hypothetical protein
VVADRAAARLHAGPATLSVEIVALYAPGSDSEDRLRRVIRVLLGEAGEADLGDRRALKVGEPAGLASA